MIGSVIITLAPTLLTHSKVLVNFLHWFLPMSYLLSGGGTKPERREAKRPARVYDIGAQDYFYI
jgi:hypothetical protein